MIVPHEFWCEVSCPKLCPYFSTYWMNLSPFFVKDPCEPVEDVEDAWLVVNLNFDFPEFKWNINNIQTNLQKFLDDRIKAFILATEYTQKPVKLSRTFQNKYLKVLGLVLQEDHAQISIQIACPIFQFRKQKMAKDLLTEEQVWERIREMGGPVRTMTRFIKQRREQQEDMSALLMPKELLTWFENLKTQFKVMCPEWKLLT